MHFSSARLCSERDDLCLFQSSASLWHSRWVVGVLPRPGCCCKVQGRRTEGTSKEVGGVVEEREGVILFGG